MLLAHVLIFGQVYDLWKDLLPIIDEVHGGVLQAEEALELSFCIGNNGVDELVVNLETAYGELNQNVDNCLHEL